MNGRPPRSPLFPCPPLFRSPVAPVVAVALVGVAPAGVTVAVTSTPLWLMGLPLASRSCTTGCCAKATPLCAVAEGGVVSVDWVAALTLIVPDTTWVSPGAVKRRVRSPAAPLIARSVKLATPLPVVVAVSVPPHAPPPPAIAPATVPPPPPPRLPPPPPRRTPRR